MRVEGSSVLINNHDSLQQNIWKERAILVAKVAVVAIVVISLAVGSVYCAHIARSMLTNGTYFKAVYPWIDQALGRSVPTVYTWGASAWKVGALYGASIGLALSSVFAAKNIGNMLQVTGRDWKDVTDYLKDNLLKGMLITGAAAAVGVYYSASFANFFGHHVMYRDGGLENYISIAGG